MKTRSIVVIIILLAIIVFILLPPFIYAGDYFGWHEGKSYPLYKSPSCWVFGIGFVYWANPPMGSIAYVWWPFHNCGFGFGV